MGYCWTLKNLNFVLNFHIAANKEEDISSMPTNWKIEKQKRIQHSHQNEPLVMMG